MVFTPTPPRGGFHAVCGSRWSPPGFAGIAATILFRSSSASQASGPFVKIICVSNIRYIGQPSGHDQLHHAAIFAGAAAHLPLMAQRHTPQIRLLEPRPRRIRLCVGAQRGYQSVRRRCSSHRWRLKLVRNRSRTVSSPSTLAARAWRFSFRRHSVSLPRRHRLALGQGTAIKRKISYGGAAPGPEKGFPVKPVLFRARAG